MTISIWKCISKRKLLSNNFYGNYFLLFIGLAISLNDKIPGLFQQISVSKIAKTFHKFIGQVMSIIHKSSYKRLIFIDFQLKSIFRRVSKNNGKFLDPKILFGK